MKALVAALLLGLLTGCANTLASPHGIEGPVRLGELAYAGGPRVRPDRLIEDSRCPAGVQCVWAGRVVVGVTVLGGNWTKQMDLTLGVPAPVADGTLTLVAVQPDRTSRDPIEPQQYRFTFAFQGGL